MHNLTTFASLIALLHLGAIFGFFYAWVCSTMWGLDAADPRTAIAAMQAMNASVRNAVFMPAFFLTPVFCAVAAGLAMSTGARRAAICFGLAGLVYFLGAFLPTAIINVPMNEALGARDVPDSIEAAREIWQNYSGRWQIANQARTLASGAALLLGGYALLNLRAA